MKYGIVFIQKILLAIVVVVIASIALAEGRNSEQGANSKEIGSQVRIGAWITTDTLDPAYVSVLEQFVIFDALFDGLIKRDNNGIIVSGQAASWEVSPDGKRYTFHLRDDIFWTDGKPVLAQDFVLAFRRILDPVLKGTGRPSYLLTNIKNANAILAKEAELSSLGVTAPDDNTLVIELTAPASYFFEILDYPGLVPVPSHMVEKYGDDWWRQKPFVSNGAYQLVDLVSEQDVILKLRNKEAYPNAPETVKFVAMNDLKEAIRQILEGKLDIAWDLRKQEADWMEERIGAQNIVATMPMTTYVTLNTTSPKLSDKRVRQAINLVTDRKSIAKARFAPLANTLAVPDMLAHASSQVKERHQGLSYEQRLEKAQALMKEAGYGPDNLMSVEITILDRIHLKMAATALRSMFSQIWVNAELKVLDGAELLKRLNGKDFEVGVEYWIADYYDGMTFYHLFQSDGTRNRPRFTSALYDELIEKALNEQDIAARHQIYSRLEAILYEEAPVIPLSHGNFVMIVSPRIADSGLDPLFLAQIPRMSLKKPETKTVSGH